MRKFEVNIKEVHTQIIQVEAKDEEEARRKAGEIVETGVLPDGSNLPNATEYSYTLDSDGWAVWEV